MIASRPNAWLLAAAFLAMPVVASATGGLSCSIDDGNAALSLEAAFSYSDIGGLFQVRGSLETRDKRVYKSLGKLALEDADIRQQWFRGDVLKLMVYRETTGDGEPFAAVKMIIEAEKRDADEFDYSGSYVLTVEPATDDSNSQAFTLDGKVTCTAG